MSEDYETQFPEGLRVLAVDDNVVCLKVLVTTLEQCQYRVTATTKACEALEMLKENPKNFDIVITDVKMPDMDGFALLEIIGLEMDIPVIMTSGTDDKSTVLKGITHGARDYLLKPVRIQEIKNIWQHVVRKNLFGLGKPGDKKEKKAIDMEKSKEKEEGGGGEEEEEDHHPKEQHDLEDGSARKKQRLNWTSALHIKFLNAIHQLGTADKAVPKKILEIMNEPGLSRENVASHLQKYRKMLRKNIVKVNQLQSDNNNLDTSSRRRRRPSDAAIFSESNSRNPPNNIWEVNNVDSKTMENQDLLLQQCLQSPQLAMSSSTMHMARLGGLPSTPFFPRTPTMINGDFMDVPLQFPSNTRSSQPCPLPYPEPPSFRFADFPSPSSYQTVLDASTGMLGTVNPNFFLVQHEGGHVNFNEGQRTGGNPLNMQDPSLKVNNQIFMQHCQENFDMESSMHLNQYTSSMDDDLSIIMKHV